MLQSMKERMTGPIIWIIMLILIVPFAFFGVEQFAGGGGDPVIAEVDGDKITQSQFQRAYQLQYQRLAQMFGESFRADMIDSEQFRAQVLDDMIRERVLRSYAESEGYATSDSELLEYLRQIPAFQDDGAFSAERYRTMLGRAGQSPEQYEAMLRNALAIEQLRDGVLASSFISDGEFALDYRIRNQKRALRYVRFPVSSYVGDIDISDEQVREHYDAHRERYQAPERIRLAYVELDKDALPPAAEPGQDVLRLIYDAEKDTRFSQPEQRRARHILVRFGADRDAALEKARQLRAQIEAGADFAELARRASEDPASRGDGGSLGWVRRGQFDERFEEAVFSQAEGEVGGPVESEFGYHLIRVDEVRPARIREFEDEEVQSELVELYRAREAERRFADLAEQIEEQAFQESGSLQAAAAAAGLEVKTTDWLTRGSDSGPMAYPAVREAAFSTEVLEGENSDPLVVSPTRLLVIRRQDYEPARTRPLEEVAEQIRSQLRNEAARAQAAEAARQAMQRARQGTALDDIAGEAEAAVVAPGLVSRDQSGIPAAVLDTLFRMPRPSGDRPSFDTARADNGDAVLIALDAVAEPDPAAVAAAQRQSERARLREAAAGAEFLAMLEAIRRAADVEVEQAPFESAPLE